MQSGQWSADIDGQLEALWVQAGGSPQPIAVFDADGTLWAGDATEDFLAYVDEKQLFRPSEVRDSVLSHYFALVERDPHEAYAWGARVCAGLAEDQVQDWALDCFEQRTAHRMFSEMGTLIQTLHARQWHVYIVSASPVWVVLPGALHLGIPSERVLAIDVERSEGKLTQTIREPMSMGQGKVACIHETIGGSPLLAVGNSLDDVPMMTLATGLAIVVNPSDGDGIRSSLQQLAVERGWAIHHTATGSQQKGING